MIVLSTHPSERRHTLALRSALADISGRDWVVAFGDRREMLEHVLRHHYAGSKVIHVCGGDTPHGTDGHPDHRTRDAISMIASVHCVANEYARENLAGMGIVKNVHVTGAPGLDEVVRYAKNLDPGRQRVGVFEWFPERGGRRMSAQPFLKKLAHCELFRSDSSSALYEAPILGTPVELVGDRQTGRRGPYHDPDGRACEKIKNAVKLEVYG